MRAEHRGVLPCGMCHMSFAHEAMRVGHHARAHTKKEKTALARGELYVEPGPRPEKKV